MRKTERAGGCPSRARFSRIEQESNRNEGSPEEERGTERGRLPHARGHGAPALEVAVEAREVLLVGQREVPDVETKVVELDSPDFVPPSAAGPRTAATLRSRLE